ncbi:transmembrane protein fuseless isoform X2 [Choristoneura fumiferana]
MSPNATDSLLPEQETIQVQPRDLEKAGSVESFKDVAEVPCCCEDFEYGAGDAVFSCFVVAPLVVGVWRGTWGLMEIHRELFPYAQSYTLAIVIHVCFALLRSYLLARSAGAWRADGGAGRWLRERALSRIYTYIFILSNIMHWRGGWGLFDAAVAIVAPKADHHHRPATIALFTLLFYSCAVALRSSRNILASPCFLVTDGKEPTYIFSTRFKITSTRETALYVLDCVFSVAVVGSLVVFVWRGSWALLDIFLFPDDAVRSCWTSVVVGYGLVIATFALQAPVRWAAARLHGAFRLLLADVYHLLSFLATVNVWRGLWGLLDIYLFPDVPKISNWTTHIVSLTLLILLNCSNSILVRGVYIDGEEPAGECVVFPCHYLRIFIHKERTKKRHRQALATAAAAANKKIEEVSVPLQMPEEKV